jgi:hypothetical protein
MDACDRVSKEKSATPAFSIVDVIGAVCHIGLLYHSIWLLLFMDQERWQLRTQGLCHITQLFLFYFFVTLINCSRIFNCVASFWRSWTWMITTSGSSWRLVDNINV